jgi:Tol biopolymer transport system component
MGEVYLARDTRLGREVALKVLPRAVSADPGRRARFEREARAISALSHPHVCALFDVGRADDEGDELEYLVMERLEGETLAARLERGPLPVPEALALGRQLAGALAAAHRRGIVHRDLKPGNVMLTRSGAKLLDFGLARHGESEPASEDEQHSTASLATEQAPLTREGTLVGTWPYLSPEQLRGRPADARSDVFALGCVLFEALSGGRAFQGTARADILAAVLSADPPDLREAVPGTPAALAALVRQCLAKDPGDRWQCADDVARGLSLVEEGLGRTVAEPAKAASRWPLAVGVLGLAAAALAVGLLLTRRPPPPAPLRFPVPPPEGIILPRPTTGSMLAISPDGRRVVFAGAREGAPRLWVWSAEEGQSRMLDETTGAISPFFSPDGRDVAFFAGDELRRVPASGGPATVIARAPLATSGTWGPDGTILFTRFLEPDAGLYVVPAAGGEPRLLASAASPVEIRMFPRFLPDGRHYLFGRGFGMPAAERQLCVASLDGGAADCFASCSSQGEYSTTGHVLCTRAGKLIALPFDARARRPTGEPAVVSPEVRWFGPTGAASFAVSADGSTLVHEPRPFPSRLVWLDRDGREVATIGEPRPFGFVQLAPDGRHAAVDVWQDETGGRDVWSVDTVSGVARRLTFAALDAWAPAWSPDGTRLAYASGDLGPPDIRVLRLAGNGGEQTLVRDPGVQFPRHFSPDGRLLLYEDYPGGRFDQRRLKLHGEGPPRFAVSAPAGSYHGRFSPDGRQIAYVSEESGRPEVYLAALDGGRPPRRVSPKGGVLPRFRGDGRELFFFQPDGMLMAASLADEGAPPRSLFHIEGVTAFDFDFDVARDGERFLVRLAPEAEGSAGLRVAIGWSKLLPPARPGESR